MKRRELMKIRRATSLTIVLLACLVAATWLAAGESERRADSRWVLVRLSVALDAAAGDGGFSLGTGVESVDALIRDLGIHRIEYALPASAGNPAHPAALRRHGLDRTYRFHVPAGVDVHAVARAFDALDDVDFAEPDYVGEATATVPTDLRFPDQWHLDQATDADVDGPEAWDLSTGSPSVVIGIADSGIDVDHVDLDGTLWVNTGEIEGNGIDDDGNGYVDDVHGWNFATGTGDVDDLDGHGTWVSSLAVAETNNGQGIAGVCWDCRVMSTVRAADTHSDYADSVIWAADHGAQVVNGSWSDALAGSSTLLSAVGYLADLGVVHVNSAGNYPALGVSYPAAYVETIAVAATTITDQPWSSSSYGPEVDVSAAGQDVLGAYFDGGYIEGDGTSGSAPQAAGLVGLVLSVNPSAGQSEIRHLIRSGAEDQVGFPPDPAGFDENKGWGRINAHRTLQAAQSAITLEVEGKAATRLTLATPNPIADSYDFARGDLGALRENPYGVEVGELLCLENDSPDADTLGNEDTDIPAPGEGFFYVARFNAAPGAGSYGGSSRRRDRLVFDQATDASWIFEGDQDGARLGRSGPAGDVNGDGFGDLIVGAFGYDHAVTNGGRAYVYSGSATGLMAEAPAWTFDGDQADGNAGWAVATAGDVDGDGYDDVLVGAPFYDAGETNEGRVYLFLGSSSGLETTPAWIFDGDQANAQLGRNVAPAGDVNGDGYDDILLGSHQYASAFPTEGRAFLFLGSASGPGSTPDWTFDGGQENARLTSGSGLAPAGDVDGDGFDDVVIGASRHDNGQTDEGRVYVFLGSSSGLAPTPDLVIERDTANARFGWSVAGAGDVDGDGYDDLVAGARDDPAGGAVFLYLGGPLGPDDTADWSFSSDQPGSRVGSRVAGGDIDGDGFSDVAVGSQYYAVRRSEEGRVWLFRGSMTGLATDPTWSRYGRDTGARYSGVSAVGDLDGDGRTEYAITAAVHDVADRIDAGRVYVYQWPLSMDTPADCPK
jgi:subtilisin family serine protease